MPDTIVNIPLVGPVTFPGSMSDADMEKAAAKLHADALAKTEPHIGAEPTFAGRMGAAVGPAIRGVGDITGANRILEGIGAVEPGRLTNDEANLRDARTRSTTAVGGLAMGGAQVLDAVTSAVGQRGLTAVGRALAAAQAAGHQLSPIVKYEIAKTTLEKIGIKESYAMMAAGLVAGWNPRAGVPRGPSAPAEPPHAPSAPGYDRYMQNTSPPPGPRPAAPVEPPPAPAPRPPQPPPPPAPAPPPPAPAAAPPRSAPPTTAPSGATVPPPAASAAPEPAQYRNPSKPPITPEQLRSVQKLDPLEQEHYLQLRQIGDTHAEATSTLDHLREIQRVKDVRAMKYTGDAAREVYGTETDATKARLEQLAPEQMSAGRQPATTKVFGETPVDPQTNKYVTTPKRQPTYVKGDAIVEAMNARYRDFIRDPKAAWLLPLLSFGGTLGAAAQQRQKD